MVLRKTLMSFLAFAVIGACAPSEEEAPEPRIPVNPTGPDALPAAITGSAPAPQGQPVHYVPGDTVSAGYVAIPEGDGPFPALVIIHEWNGLVDRIRQMADGFAAEGYVTLAVDLYRGRTGSNREENVALVQETQADREGMINNLNEAVRFLRAREDVTGRVASMGWCFGGGVALSFALGGENHDGTAIFYGSLLDDPDSLGAITHEVYGTFAEMDGGIPPDQVERFVAALDQVGVPNDVHVYDDVNHGFWLRVEEDPDVRTAPALDAWQRLKAYLARTLSTS
jgi:carboxymethylenebutenolidase